VTEGKKQKAEDRSQTALGLGNTMLGVGFLQFLHPIPALIAKEFAILAWLCANFTSN
jgi:hypothetical protein